MTRAVPPCPNPSVEDVACEVVGDGVVSIRVAVRLPPAVRGGAQASIARALETTMRAWAVENGALLAAEAMPAERSER